MIASYHLTKQKLSFGVGLLCSTLAAILLFPLFRELSYHDYADSKAIVFLIILNILFGVMAIYFSKK